MSASARRTVTVALAAMVVFLTVCLVLFPEDGLAAAVSGMKMFWDVVFPSLLPFFILSELLLGLGVVNMLGVLLEPLMRPLFSVPGVGAFALSMGLAAGYPMDAVITARFRKSGLCTRVEGERLLAFTNTADPLFMFAAVAVGMFHNAALGAILAIAHYIAAFLVGICFKLYGRKQEDRLTVAVETRQRGSILRRAYRELMRARAEDGRTLGKLLGDAANDSIRTLLMICGFIVFFAVLIKVMGKIGALALLGVPMAGLFHVFGIDPSLIHSALAGLFEIDIGSAAASQAHAPLVQQLLIVSGIIAWSGLSVHAQVASVLTDTDIRMGPYFIARGLHAVLAAVSTVILFNTGLGHQAVNVFAGGAALTAQNPLTAAGGWISSLHMVGVWASVVGAILAASLLWYILRGVRLAVWRRTDQR